MFKLERLKVMLMMIWLLLVGFVLKIGLVMTLLIALLSLAAGD